VAVAEAVLALALLWGVARTQPHEEIEAPGFESVASGDFGAVANEGDMLLAAWDYPRAILLLWRAADAGIEPAACHTHVARLFYDYQAYLGHHERGGLPEAAQEQWVRRAGAAGRGWAAYARAELRTARALAPDDFAANYGLGQLLCSEERVAEGIPYLRAALRAQPDHVELLLDLAAALTREGENDEARELADRLQTLAPDHPRLKPLLDALDVDG
jgi:tetratricopeptide (TPR) repeat protein